MAGNLTFAVKVDQSLYIRRSGMPLAAGRAQTTCAVLYSLLGDVVDTGKRGNLLVTADNRASQ